MLLRNQKKRDVYYLEIQIEEEIINQGHCKDHKRHRKQKSPVETETLERHRKNVLDVENHR